MSDESNIPANLEAHKELSVEVQPKEQQQLPVAEGPQTEVLQQQQEKGESGKKPSTTSKAFRLGTISKLLEKQTTQIGQIVQPLEKQLKSMERRIEVIKLMSSQLKQLQKQMSQVQKESHKIRILLSKKTTFTKKNTSKKKNSKSKK